MTIQTSTQFRQAAMQAAIQQDAQRAQNVAIQQYLLESPLHTPNETYAAVEVGDADKILLICNYDAAPENMEFCMIPLHRVGEQPAPASVDLARIEFLARALMAQAPECEAAQVAAALILDQIESAR